MNNAEIAQRVTRIGKLNAEIATLASEIQSLLAGEMPEKRKVGGPSSKDRVLEYLRSPLGGWKGFAEIVDAVGVSKRTTAWALQQMRGTVLTQREDGKYAVKGEEPTLKQQFARRVVYNGTINKPWYGGVLLLIDPKLDPEARMERAKAYRDELIAEGVLERLPEDGVIAKFGLKGGAA